MTIINPPKIIQIRTKRFGDGNAWKEGGNTTELRAAKFLKIQNSQQLRNSSCNFSKLQSNWLETENT